MKRILFLVALCLALAAPAFAAHIKGGFFTYKYLGPGSAGRLRYQVTLTVYMVWNATPAQANSSVTFTFYDAQTFRLVDKKTVSVTSDYILAKTTDDPCITGDQRENYYKIMIYDLSEIELPASPGGHIVSYQRCCRISGVVNIASSGTIGNTYSINIPGTNAPQNGFDNKSPVFPINDTVVVCANNYFEYSFQATDPDPTDRLTYEFCDAWVGGGQNNSPNNPGDPNGPTPDPALPPPYSSVPYVSPFSGSFPLGSQVTINSTTGLISGVAPDIEGEYVVTVCVNEYRNGVYIASSRKELHIKVKRCESTKPVLDLSVVTCDGFNRTFNILNSSNPEIRTLFWDFGDGSTSTEMSPTHTYAVAGDYTIKVVANRGDLCADSTTGVVKIYPGFFPDFNTEGVCLTNPVRFFDATTTNYGVVDSWQWDFGDLTTTSDVSTLQNPQWTYATVGTKTISLKVTNSKGCVSTITKDITIIDKPPITLGFKDTLICVPDAVQLQASGTGSFSWTPTTNMDNPNTGTPTVNPTTTTTYQVQLDLSGCINTDEVTVRVVDFVTLSTMPDTTICRTDPVQLRITSDGLRYEWTPTASLDNPTAKQPIATPLAPVTDYQVIAHIGSCSATDYIRITTVPYPIANAGPDTTICYNTPAFLHGSHDGTRFSWSPTASLVNAGTLTPTAYPSGPGVRPYVLTVYNDLIACPKPGRDTVLVTVLPKIVPFAGNDTMVVVGQPLQLNATGGVSYSWTPSIGLSNTNIANPVGVYSADIDSIRYKVYVYNQLGCFDSAFIKVTVFKTNPYVFVPTGFTPNGDGLNDVLRPIAVGVREIKYFRVFNRWGQMVFSTTINGHGWDGRVNGAPQGSNVYVWMVGAIDYTGRPITLKGTSTLIR